MGITQISGNISNNKYPLSWVIKQLFHTFLCNSQNYHPRGAVDDPMHCCPRPSASGNTAAGHPQHLVGDSFDCCTERYEIVVYCLQLQSLSTLTLQITIAVSVNKNFTDNSCSLFEHKLY